MKSWSMMEPPMPMRYGADLEVGLAAHRSDGDGCTAEAEQLFLNILGDVGYLIAVLNLMTVDTERGQTLLSMGCRVRTQGILRRDALCR